MVPSFILLFLSVGNIFAFITNETHVKGKAAFINETHVMGKAFLDTEVHLRSVAAPVVKPTKKPTKAPIKPVKAPSKSPSAKPSSYLTSLTDKKSYIVYNPQAGYCLDANWYGTSIYPNPPDVNNCYQSWRAQKVSSSTIVAPGFIFIHDVSRLCLSYDRTNELSLKQCNEWTPEIIWTYVNNTIRNNLYTFLALTYSTSDNKFVASDVIPGGDPNQFFGFIPSTAYGWGYSVGP